MNSDTQRYDRFTESREREEAKKKGRKKRKGYSTSKRMSTRVIYQERNPLESIHD